MTQGCMGTDSCHSGPVFFCEEREEEVLSHVATEPRNLETQPGRPSPAKGCSGPVSRPWNTFRVCDLPVRLQTTGLFL